MKKRIFCVLAGALAFLIVLMFAAYKFWFPDWRLTRMARDAVQTMRDNTNYLREFHEDRRCRIEVFRYPDTQDALYVRDY